MTARTEEEMKQIWCQEARTYGYNGSSVNRDSGRPDQSCYCLGSECGAWRWWEYTVQQLVSKTQKEGWEHVSASDAEDGIEYWVEPHEAAQKRRRGYCGKAGDVRFL